MSESAFTLAGLKPRRQVQSPSGNVSTNCAHKLYGGSIVRCTLILLKRFKIFQKSSISWRLISARSTFSSPTSSTTSFVFFSSSASRESNQSSPLPSAFFAAMAKSLLLGAEGREPLLTVCHRLVKGGGPGIPPVILWVLATNRSDQGSDVPQAGLPDRVPKLQETPRDTATADVLQLRRFLGGGVATRRGALAALAYGRVDHAGGDYSSRAGLSFPSGFFRIGLKICVNACSRGQ